MSEEEKKQRLSYRKNRKRIIAFMCVLLTISALVTIFAGALAVIFNKTYYVDYTEKSSVDYGVYLKENGFYEENYVDKDYAYIASLIDKIQAKFAYELLMDSKEPISFEYAYRVDAIVEIKDNRSGKVLFAPVYNEVAETTSSRNDTGVDVYQTVLIDYAKYNDIANRFIETYDLEATANLVLKMYVDIVGVSDEFENEQNKNSHVSTLTVPLTLKTVEVKITSSAPSEEQKVLSYTTEDTANLFKSFAFMLLLVTALLALIVILYAYLSRNVDVTYDIKVAKIVRSYKSFIQKIRNRFDLAGHQLLVIDTFVEMLEIRDTIQSPILMEENEDRTCTRFFIPTLNGIVYMHEIKVDDYDEIYGSDRTRPTEEVYRTPDYYESRVADTTASYSAKEKPITVKVRVAGKDSRPAEDNRNVSAEWLAEPSIYVRDGEETKQTKKMRVRISLNEEK